VLRNGVGELGVYTPYMLELEMPSDFPVKPYDSVWKSLEGLGGEYYRAGEDSKYQSWQQWLSAWIGIAYRFRSCAEHDQAFAESVSKYGDNPSQPENYHQDRELFGFFVSGLSAIESTCYGLFAVGSILDFNNFPLTTEQHMRNATTTKTVQQFAVSFPNDGITAALQRIMSEQPYTDWKAVRNTLAHRTNPGRIIYASTVGPPKTVEWMLQNIPIDNTSTASRRRWLADSLRYLLTEADNFTAKHF
jgi:hypothetical protein